MPDRDEEEYQLAAALLLLWIAFSRISKVGPTAFKLFREQFDIHITPVLKRLYGTARTELGRGFGANYVETESSSGSGATATRVPGMDHRIDAYANRLWGTFQNRLEKIEAKKSAGEPVEDFGQSDAELISITELSQLQSDAEMDAAEDVNRSVGSRLVAVWRTEPGACPICSPLNGTTREWKIKFPHGPPAHPRCRCWLDWREFLG